jgi:predicted metalloendopeptidase
MDYDYNTEIETTSNYYDSYDDYYSDDEYEYTQEIINELNNDSEYEYNENEEFSSDKLIISIKDFNEKYPLINWKLYFEKVFEKYGIAITDESLISEESNFKYVYEFLKETDNKDITNFLEWNIIKYFLDIGTQINVFKNIISDELYQAKIEYEKAYYDEEDIDDEEEIPIFEGDDPNSKCINLVDEYMPFALSKYYAEMKFPKNIKPEAMDMIENIRNSMIDRIKKLEWLDESTREHAIEKVLKIKYSIGYSDYVMNVENIYNNYKLLFLTKNDILSLLIRITNSKNKKIYDLFYNENYIESQISNYFFDLFSKTYIVNAFYDSMENSMIFPAAILQSPKYDVNQPDYINYGNIGSVMGH